MKEYLELVVYLWPLINYKISEFFKRSFGEAVTIKSSHGEITGIKVGSRYGFHYINFLGIPYAKPPIGNLRFKDPEPVEPWTQAVHACSESAAAQKDLVLNMSFGSEDCLHLNIYTKNCNPKTLYPVMVFFHGGAFIFGSNNKEFYNPEYLLRKDIVLIVVNYRLGVFGFLSISDPCYEIPGNAGLKDQVMALKFIKENCERFGGDPNNITLFGESAGGSSVHYHMISDMSKGLFHKGILMSGTALNPWSIGPLDNVPQRLAKLLDWNGDGGLNHIMEILNKATPERLIKAQCLLLGDEERKRYIFSPFGPVIEPYRSKQCFVDKHPVLMCQNPWSYKMPLLIGGCSAEGLLWYKYLKSKPETITKYSRAVEEIIPFQIEPDRNSERCKYFGHEIKKFYFGMTEPSMANINTFIMMMGDQHFWHGIHRTLVSRSTIKDGGPTYLYRFDVDSSIGNYSKRMCAGRCLKGLEGACHGDDCFYLFKAGISKGFKERSNEFKAIDRMVTIWTSFARHGYPNDDSIKILDNAVWEQISSRKPFKCLNIANNLKVIDLPESERMGVWDAIYENATYD